MGCYLALNDNLTIERVVKALRERPKRAELMVAGDLNINLVAPEGGGYRGNTSKVGTGGHGRALPPAMAPMVPGREDVVHAPKGKGGVVPDRIYPGDGPPSLWECYHPRPPPRGPPSGSEIRPGGPRIIML